MDDGCDLETNVPQRQPCIRIADLPRISGECSRRECYVRTFNQGVRVRSKDLYQVPMTNRNEDEDGRCPRESLDHQQPHQPPYGYDPASCSEARESPPENQARGCDRSWTSRRSSLLTKGHIGGQEKEPLDLVGAALASPTYSVWPSEISTWSSCGLPVN